jgi:hypothetical protein
LAVAGEEVNINLFSTAKRMPGRPKETTTETPDEEKEQSTVSVLEEAHREREQPSPSSSERQKWKDPPPASKDVAAAPTKAKKRRMNWSKGDNRAKLEASLSKWNRGGALDENGGALSMTEFANIEGIPPQTFYTYASGKEKFGKRRKTIVLKTANPKAIVHTERVERLEATLVGVTMDTAGLSSLSPGISTVDRIIIQNPTNQAETSIPAETVMASNAPNPPNLNRTFTVHRKAAKRSESWYNKPPPSPQMKTAS